VVQLVECFLAKEEVVGSSPIARSYFYPRKGINLHGDVAKWQGKGLQNPHQGFKSPRRLFQDTQRGVFLLKSRVVSQGGSQTAF
jgi:hypothetical protein